MCSVASVNTQASLEELRAQVAECRRCPLCDGRTQTVFGTGNPSAQVLFIGEAPGKNEDAQGEPFVGAAGKNLDKLLELAGLSWEDIFIANVLKCRPPSNRDPRPEEIEACSAYLREQTRLINPALIVTLGNFATRFILRTGVGITRLRGTLQQTGRFKVYPVFHPAACIYDRKKLAQLEADFVALGGILRELRIVMAGETAVGVAPTNGAEGVGASQELPAKIAEEAK